MLNNVKIPIEVYIPTDLAASKIIKYEGTILVPDGKRVSDYIRSSFSNSKKLEFTDKNDYAVHIHNGYILIPHDKHLYQKILEQNMEQDNVEYEKSHYHPEHMILESLLGNFKIDGYVQHLGGGNPLMIKKPLVISNIKEIHIKYENLDDGKTYIDRNIPDVAIIHLWDGYKFE